MGDLVKGILFGLDLRENTKDTKALFFLGGGGIDSKKANLSTPSTLQVTP